MDYSVFIRPNGDTDYLFGSGESSVGNFIAKLLNHVEGVFLLILYYLIFGTHF